MSQAKVVSNAVWIIAGQVVKMLLSLVIAMLTARYLGPSNFGLINYAASIVAFVMPVMYLGFDSILVREIVNHPEREGETMGTALLLSLCSSLMCILGVIAFAYFANAGEQETVIVCALYSVLLLFQALELIKFWFQAKLLSKYATIISVIAYVVVSAYKIYLLASGKSVYWFALSNAIDYMLIAAGFLIVYSRIGGPKLRFSLVTGREMFRSGRFFIISSMMVTIFAQTDRIMLKHMLDTSAVGYYSAAITCANLVGFIFVAIIESLRPPIFEAKKHDQKDFEFKVSQLYSVIIYGSLVVSLALALFSSLIVRFLYGAEFMPAAMALKIVVWYTTFSYLGSVRNVWIVAEGKERMLWIINLSGALANIGLNIVFIPIWGINGAAFASLLTQIFTNVIVGYLLPPIRRNNRIMIQGLSFKILGGMVVDMKSLLMRKFFHK